MGLQASPVALLLSSMFEISEVEGSAEVRGKVQDGITVATGRTAEDELLAVQL